MCYPYSKYEMSNSQVPILCRPLVIAFVAMVFGEVTIFSGQVSADYCEAARVLHELQAVAQQAALGMIEKPW